MATRRKIIRPSSSVAVFARGLSDYLHLLFNYFGIPFSDTILSLPRGKRKGDDRAREVTGLAQSKLQRRRNAQIVLSILTLMNGHIAWIPIVVIASSNLSGRKLYPSPRNRDLIQPIDSFNLGSSLRPANSTRESPLKTLTTIQQLSSWVASRCFPTGSMMRGNGSKKR